MTIFCSMRSLKGIFWKILTCKRKQALKHVLSHKFIKQHNESYFDGVLGKRCSLLVKPLRQSFLALIWNRVKEKHHLPCLTWSMPGISVLYSNQNLVVSSRLCPLLAMPFCYFHCPANLKFKVCWKHLTHIYNLDGWICRFFADGNPLSFPGSLSVLLPTHLQFLRNV